jgi:hypothetical protein
MKSRKEVRRLVQYGGLRGGLQGRYQQLQPAILSQQLNDSRERSALDEWTEDDCMQNQSEIERIVLQSREVENRGKKKGGSAYDLVVQSKELREM